MKCKICIAIFVSIWIIISPAASQSSRYYGLCVGINHYPTIDSIRAAELDAQCMRDRLINYQHWQANSITLLLGANATKSQILASVGQLPKSGNTTLFYFSGHGDGDGIIPYDEARLSPAELENAFGTGYNQYAVYIAACYSGIFPAYMTHGVICSSCRSDERSYEATSSPYHDNYTYELMAGLANNVAHDQDGLMTALSLQGYAEYRVSHFQEPPQHPAYANNCTGTLYLDANIICVPRDYSTISAALAVASSGNIIVVEPGTHSVACDITIPYGVRLIVHSGATLNFTGNYKLRVEGNIKATNVTFTRSGGQWLGIEFDGNASGSEISGCTIENAQCGLFLYATYGFQINGCTITNNATGIYCRYAYHVIGHNYIAGNTIGVNCADYSQVDFQINNWIKYNTRGIQIDLSSPPQLGTTNVPVYCSIWGNDWDVWSDYSGTVSAQVNYWGSYPANPMIYVTDGTVDYSNELSWEPSMKLPANLATKSTAVSGPAKEPTPIDTAGIGELDAARMLEGRSQSLDAQSAFKSIVARYAGKLSSEIALVRLETSLDKQSIDPKEILKSYARTYKGAALGELASLLLAHRLIRDGNAEEALELCKPIADAAGKFEREALYDAGSLLWYRVNKAAEAETYYRRLIAKYPKDPLAISAMATLGESPAIDQPSKPSVAETAPTEYSVEEPYPNPFNPSTQIIFALPETGNVSLIVYDVLGRQVATLASDPYVAGRHSVKWDGSSVASGVYYARLLVTNEIGSVLFGKVTKLLLTK
jgi:hypothetical protein